MGNKLLECQNGIRNTTINKRSMFISTTLGHINARILGNTMAKSQNEPHRKLNNNKKFKIHIVKFGASVDEKIHHTKVTKFEI
jgi:hypothetical protein